MQDKNDFIAGLRKDLGTSKPSIAMPEIDKNTDMIKSVFKDPAGRVEKIVFNDGNSLEFKDFIDVFKSNLRTVMAGEIISWDDVWRFQKMTDARAMEEYLDNVEQEGILKGSRFQLSRPQKIGLGVVIIIVFIMIFALFALKQLGSM
jgi:hypothetical protein